MEIAEFIQAKGTFLKAETVKTNPNAVFVVTKEARVVESDYKGKVTQKVHVEGEFAKAPFIFDMSKTNTRTVANALGTNPKNWVGHTLVLETYKTKTSDGKMTDAINVKEVK
jgi:hypothetical protein